MSMAERTTESGDQMRDWAAIPRTGDVESRLGIELPTPPKSLR